MSDAARYSSGQWTGHYSRISVDLQDGEEARAFAAAAEEENEDVEMIESPGYITVTCPDRMVVHQETVEGILGRPWNPRDLQGLLSAYAGNITSSGQDGVWTLEWLGRKEAKA